MNELEIIIPPPRLDRGATLTLTLALAVAIHAIPLVVTAPEAAAVHVDTDVVFVCTFGCDREEPTPGTACRSNLDPFREPLLTREMAVEQALDTIEDGAFEHREVRPPPPVAHPEILALQTQGPRDKPTLKRYVKRHRAEAARCASPSTIGERTLLVQFIVDPQGRVTDTDIQGQVGALGECIERTVAAIRFPRFSTTELTQVNLPLRYGTTDASAGVFVR